MSGAPNSAAVGRIAARLLAAGVALERRELQRAALVVAAEEDPLGGRHSAMAAVDELVGMGPLEPLLADDTISDILVNGPDDVWIERFGELSPAPVSFRDGAAVAAAVERAIAPLGLRLDFASPVVDARLQDGSRLHAVLPPIAPDGPIVAIRRFTNAVRDLEAMEAAGSVGSAAASLLRQAVADRANLLVCGGTGVGKTTLLNVLSAEIDPGQRIVTIEDAAELTVAGHVVRLEARPANSEGAGALGLPELVRHALRLRPDRIIVGEVRGVEALDMIQAMATGHRGSMSTVHAATGDEALWRLELLAMSGETSLAPDAVRALLRAALDLVVVMRRRGSDRVVHSVFGVANEGLEELA